VEQALRKLLAGSGIEYKFTGPDKVTLRVSGLATTVQVTASVDALAQWSPKYSESFTDTLQTIREVPRSVMDQQGNITLRDALRNVAGISLAAGEGGAQGDNLTIGGFTARNDLFIDGMRDFGSYYRDPFNVRSRAAAFGNRNDRVARDYNIVHGRRVRARHHAIGFALGPDRRDPLGSLCDRLRADGGSLGSVPSRR
jgi:catecholate siderophore receptor